MTSPLPWFRGVLLASVLVASLSCGDNDDGGPRIAADIVITPNHPTVFQGETRRLRATVVDNTGRAVTDQSVTYSSSDEAIATVSPSGVVTSVGPLGTVEITVEQDQITATAEVEINQRAATLEIEPDPLQLNVSEIFTLTIRAIDVVGNAMDLQDLEISSSNPSVASVDRQTVTAVAAGTAELTVSLGGLTREIPVTVGIIPMRIEFSSTGLILSGGASQQLTAVVYDRLNNPIVSPGLSWSSSNSAIATVSNSGLVHSVGPNGGARITARLGTFSRDVGVYVGAVPTHLLMTTTATGGAPYAVAIAPNGRMLVSLAGSDKVLRGDLPAFTFSDTIPVALEQPLGVALSANGNTGYVAVPNGVDEVNLSTGMVTRHLALPWQAYSVLLSSDGARLFVGTAVNVYRVNTGSLTVTDSIGLYSTLDMARHPTQARLFVTDGTSVRELNQSNLGQVRRLDIPSLYAARGLAVSPDGNELYVADESNDIHVVDLGTGSTRARIATGSCFGVTLSFSYIVASCQGTLKYIDRTSLVPLETVPLGGTTRRPAAAADGTVVVASEEQGVKFVQ